jgi:dienelactone hydrolase
MKRRQFAALPAALLVQPALRAEAAERAPEDFTAVQAGSEAGSEAGGFESPAVVEGDLPVFFERLKDELTFPLAWGTSPVRDFRRWRGLARAKVEELLWQPIDRTPFDVEIDDEQPGEGYVQRTVLFNVTRHSRVRASLLVPTGRRGPFPAVLLLHDHGAKFDIGKEKLIRPWYDDTRLASAEAWAAKYFSGRFVGNELAARGYVVLSVDAIGWGDRSGMDYEGQQALASNFLNLGSSLAGLMAREDVRAAELLSGLPEVDGRRVAALGFSMGAYRAWQVAALSDRVRAAAAVCWMTALKDMMVPGNNTLRGQSAYFMLHPGLYRYLDIPDVASIAAPKPMLLFNGEQDTLFSVAGVRAAYDKLRAVWRSQHHDDRLVTKLWPGLGHVFVREMQDEAFAWLDQVVGDRANDGGR